MINRLPRSLYLLNGVGYALIVAGLCCYLIEPWLNGIQLLGLVVHGITVLLLLWEVVVFPSRNTLSVHVELPALFIHRNYYDIQIRVSIASNYFFKNTLHLDVPISFATPETHHGLHFVNRASLSTDLSFPMYASEKGDQAITQCKLCIRSLFSILEKRIVVPLDVQYIVLPQFHQHDADALQEKYLTAPIHKMQTRQKGFGYEFHQLREYVRGDDFKKIHWKQTAKKDRLIVKDVRTERGLNVFTLIDSGRLMSSLVDEQTKLDWCIEASVSLAYVAQQKGDVLGGLCFAQSVVDELPPKKDNQQVVRMSHFLANIKPVLEEPNYNDATIRVLHMLRGRSLIIYFSDLLDDFYSEILVRNIILMQKRHQVLFCSVEDLWMRDTLYDTVTSLDQGIAQAMARENKQKRAVLIRKLQQYGVEVISVHPKYLKEEMIDGYMRMRGF